MSATADNDSKGIVLLYQEADLFTLKSLLK